MKTLYKFTLHEKTGLIEVEKITDYKELSPSKLHPEQIDYVYTGKSGHRYYIHSYNLDKLVNWRYYTFCTDFEAVQRAIYYTVISKKNEYYNHYMRYEKVSQLMVSDGEESNE